MRDRRLLLLGLPNGSAAAVSEPLHQAGATVELGPAPPHGLRHLRRQPFDLVVLALAGRPGANLGAVRSCRRYNDAGGIVALLPQTAADQAAAVLNSGADDCLAIPFASAELLARLGAVARRVARRPVAAAVLRVHDLEIDLVKHRVHRAGQAIDLTRREFALLQLLAQHQGQIVSRHMIWEQLYEAHDRYTSNVIEVYIRYLRAKIDQGHDTPLILTRWGEGYYLRGEP